VTQEQTAAFEVGKTTEAQVVAALGNPNGVSTLADGSRVDVYTHVAAHATAASYVPIVGIFAGGAKATSNTAVFNFDPHGVLTSTHSGSSQTSVSNMGGTE
jgi:outer membrane protein assembly factor BamE (lipoprotein component of BamABCDE complex)